MSPCCDVGLNTVGGLLEVLLIFFPGLRHYCFSFSVVTGTDPRQHDV